MTRVPFIRLCHRMPGLREIARRVPVHWFFNWIEIVVPLIGWFSLHARKQARYICEAMDGSLNDERRWEVARRHLILRKWRICLIYAWCNLADRYTSWIRMEGEAHLNKALAVGNGAILLSGHAYGLSVMIPPVLAKKGYLVLRTGMTDPARRARRWGKAPHHIWQYVAYNGDYWHRFRALNQIRQGLEANGVLHIDIRGFPEGDPKVEIDFCHKKLFLDVQVLRLIEILKAPVLPCFAVCDDEGRVVIKIYPALDASADKIVTIFGSLYAFYLKEFPEYANIWGRVIRQEEF